MKINFRNLNTSEKYACGINDIKKVFSCDDDIYVSFGYLGRSYCFDSKFIRRPHINGQIISAMEINKRLNVEYSAPILQFYVIRDDRYNDACKAEFCSSVLPKISEWFNKTVSTQNILIPGVEVMLTEWTGTDFELHLSRFA